MTVTTESTPAPTAGWHEALLYDSDGQYVSGVLGFVDAAVAANRPVLVAVPDTGGALLRARMNGRHASVQTADMADIGRNPGRIIPAIAAFMAEHPGRPVSFVGEPIWPGRSPAEVAEATRHEALINAAFGPGVSGFGASGCGTSGHGAIDVLCPYDVRGLEPAIVDDAFRTHPAVVGTDGRRRASDRYTDPQIVWSDTGHLAPPPAGARRFSARRETVAELRVVVRRLAGRAGLSAEKVDDLVLVVTELATNSVVHGGGTGAVTIWAESGRVSCEVRDVGVIDDPLSGRVRPSLDRPHGRGLWLANQLSELFQLHSSAQGTVIRITV